MSELRVVRGRDLELRLNGEELCGVTFFRAVSQNKANEIREYLSSDPVAVLPGAQRHEIELSALEMFGGAVPEGESFSLSVIDPDSEYVYEGCIVVRKERSLSAKGSLSVKYLIKAEKMTKRGISDA